jgi:hypothetical protein
MQMDIKNRKVQLIGVAVVIIIVVLLVVLVPGSDGGTSTPTPTPTGTPAPTLTGGPTSTPKPTATFTGEGYNIYFTETDYQVSGEGQEFYTTINITPIERFYGAQFVLVWDCTLFEMDTGWTQSKGVARLYNGTSPNPGWTDGVVALNPTGDNPQCPDPKQGRVNFVVEWSDYYGIIRDGEGVDVTEDGTLLTARWRTHSGGDFKSGDTDIRFAPEMEICGYLDGGYQYTKPVYWHNTSVAVE